MISLVAGVWTIGPCNLQPVVQLLALGLQGSIAHRIKVELHKNS